VAPPPLVRFSLLSFRPILFFSTPHPVCVFFRGLCHLVRLFFVGGSFPGFFCLFLLFLFSSVFFEIWLLDRSCLLVIFPPPVIYSDACRVFFWAPLSSSRLVLVASPRPFPPTCSQVNHFRDLLTPCFQVAPFRSRRRRRHLLMTLCSDTSFSLVDPLREYVVFPYFYGFAVMVTRPPQYPL